MSDTIVLGIETSCDETSAAVLRGEREILSHIILSQDVHKVYGGVVPELASRAHLRVIDDVVTSALSDAGLRLEDIDLFGVTAGPGLIGALLVGLTWGKAAAFALDKPIIGVHHMEAHIFATSLENEKAEPPFVALLVSGGHTMLLWVPQWGRYELLGETRDDAVGEAFDKVAKILGLGYPGGPVIQRVAKEGDARRYDFPRPMLYGGQSEGEAEFYDFSFSGLKTSVLTKVRAIEAKGQLEAETAHLAASFQRTVVDVLVGKVMRAASAKNCNRIVLGGGVAASAALREGLKDALGEDGELYYPSLRLATDNAAMIARTALYHYGLGETSSLDFAARADMPFPGLVR